MDRRAFLYGSLLVTTQVRYSGWSIFNKRKLNNLGLQLSTITATLVKDFAGTLEKVSEIGYNQV